MNRRVIFEIADLLTSNESIVTSVGEVLKVHFSNVTYLRISFQFKTRYRMIYNFYFIKEVLLYCSLQLAQFVKKYVQEMANIVARSGRATTRLSLVCDIKAKYFSCYGNYEVDGQNTFF